MSRTRSAAATVLHAPSPAITARIAQALGKTLHAGDVVLLSGPVGAGKSHFARALIQSRLAALGRTEDVPSPTFTLVQCYALDGVELWHADLYRLTDVGECMELGLDQAFETAICLVEWPDRLGKWAPQSALRLDIAQGAAPDARVLRFEASDPRWQPVLARLAA